MLWLLALPPPATPTWVHGALREASGPSVPVRCDTAPAQPCEQLWPGAAPNETAGFPGAETRAGNDGAGCGPARATMCDHIYNVSEPSLTPFVVHNGSGAAVIIAPGGGYHDLSWSKEGLDVARMFNRLGVSAFVLKYRVPSRPAHAGLPHWWAPLQDGQRAISLVRARASQWGLNSSRIGFAGFSAGGHLTAHVSTAWRHRAYAKVDGSDDISCRPDFALLLYPWWLLANNRVPRGGQPLLAPEFNTSIDAAHPVAAFFHNLDDPTAPPAGTLTYVGRLLAVDGAAASVHLGNRGGHGFGLCQGRADYLEVCDWPKQAQRFLQDHLAPGWPEGAPTEEEMLRQNCERKDETLYP